MHASGRIGLVDDETLLLSPCALSVRQCRAVDPGEGLRRSLRLPDPKVCEQLLRFFHLFSCILDDYAPV